MTTSKGRPGGRFAVGLVFAVAGLVFFLVSFSSDESSSAGLGAALMAVGAVLMATAVAAARKSHADATTGETPGAAGSRGSRGSPEEP